MRSWYNVAAKTAPPEFYVRMRNLKYRHTYFIHVRRLVQYRTVMTLLHFINCIGVAYAPYFIIYRFSGLSESSVFWRCVKAAAAYLITQGIKMLLLASLFPLNAVEDSKNEVVQEALKCTVDLLDLLGIYVVLTKILGRGEMKVMVTVIGWGTAEVISTKLFPLWVGARGVEFQWTHLQVALDSNLNLLFLIIIGALLWLWSRNDINKTLRPLIGTMLILLYFKPLIVHQFQYICPLDIWTMLIAKLIIGVLMGVVVLHMYAVMSPPLTA